MKETPLRSGQLLRHYKGKSESRYYVKLQLAWYKHGQIVVLLCL